MTLPLCPFCGLTPDGLVDPRPDDPRPPECGDAMACERCAMVSVFEGGGLRPPTASEFRAVLSNPDAAAVVLRLRQRVARRLY